MLKKCLGRYFERTQLQISEADDVNLADPPCVILNKKINYNVTNIQEKIN